MSTPRPGRRPHRLAGIRSLAELPLDGGGLEKVEFFLASSEHEEIPFEVWRPTPIGGSRKSPSALASVPSRFQLSPTESARGPVPRFESDGACVRAQVAFPIGTSFYGTGLVAGPLLRNGRAVELWNTDAWRYGEETPSLYQSHPYVLALLPDGKPIGLLADSVRRGAILCAQDGVEFQFEGQGFDLYVILGDDWLELFGRLTKLIGRMSLPPLWSLGYHQSRWSYASASELLELAREFRERKIPCDALWLDIDYMDRRRSFTWDGERFPDPRGLTEALRKQGFHTVAILDPGLAVDPSYEPCASGLAGGHFVRDSRGEPARGRVWPGICHFPDFTREATRAWWAGLVERFVRESGIDGLWTDMNEPSLFRAPTRTLPEDARHAGLGGGTHGELHNLYGQLMAQATRDGLARARPGRRSFVLTRSNHISGARFAATWTGDNQARWEDLAWTIPMELSLGLCGQPFSGPDLGGFDGDPDAELFERWFELGAYLPFARGHSEKSACRKEPWSFGHEVEARVRGSLERRMRLLPFLYTLSFEASSGGLPMARPLFFADPVDLALRSIDDTFLLGDDLLIAPVLHAGARERDVHLPRHGRGGWYHFSDLGAHPEHHVGPALAPGIVRASAPLGETPVYTRAGSILPLGPVQQHSGERVLDPLELHVFLDAHGMANGGLYEDAGDGAGHRITLWTARWSAGELHLEPKSSGSLRPPARRRVIRVYGAPGSTHVREIRDEG